MVSVNKGVASPAAAGSASSAGNGRRQAKQQGNVDAAPKQGGASAAPTGCGTRPRAEDSALAAASLAAHLRGMEPAVLDALVRARQSAAGITAAFPGGDQRFVSDDSESGEELADAEATDAEDEGEPCVGLFDDTVDPSPKAALQRARDASGLDLLGDMRRLKMPFHVRVRAANYLRRLVKEGVARGAVVAQLREAMGDRASPVWGDDALLKPVLEGDLLLTALDDDSDDEEDEMVAETVHNAINRC